MVLARSAEAHRALNGQFASHTVTKRYHALVRGLPPWEEKRVELYLRVDGDRRHRTAVSDAASGHPAGKPAVTCLRVIERLQQYTLIEAIPQTGRTHQIRAHRQPWACRSSLISRMEAVRLCSCRPSSPTTEDRGQLSALCWRARRCML
jgi:23S rRNA-/tRNA-specific pseudouridylate synthase